MHRLPSSRSIFIFRIAALLLWLIIILPLTGIGVLIYGAVHKQGDIVMLGASLIILTGVVLVLQMMVATHTRCPLCITPVLANKNCAKNKKSKRFLGSYRLRVATSILFRSHFRCPYCSEPTAMVVRDRNRVSRRAHTRH